ncbi:MAG: zinc-binding dehydrogenase [Anaerolineae bacterium]
MKAVIFYRRGGVDQLKYEDVPTPQISAHEVLVRVKACALNHLDIFARRGAQGVKVPLPHILGLESAGEVVEVGAQVRSVKVGQRVLVNPKISCGRCEYCLAGQDNLCMTGKLIGIQVDGGYAEYLKAPAENVIPLPVYLSYEEAAAIPVAFGTAWHMLVSRAGLKAGETVLILAAGSGVGSAAVQVAKYLGARVIATASSDEKLARAKELGADEVINYSQDNFSHVVKRLTGNRGVDVVFEHVGPNTWEKSVASLAPNGRLVTCGATTGRWGRTDLWSLFGKQLSLLGSFGASQKDVEAVADLVGQGKLKPVIDRCLPLQEAALAHRLLEERKVFGKVILRP